MEAKVFLQEKLDYVIGFATNMTFQVLARNSKGRATQIGSAFGVQINHRRYLVTAEHVIKEASSSEHHFLLVHKSGRILDFKNDVANSNYKIFLNPSNDFCYIYSELFENLDESYFYKYEDISDLVESSLEEDYCGLAIGYPNSKNKKFTDKNGVPSRISALYLSDIVYARKNNIYTQLNCNPAEYILQICSQKAFIDGNEMESPSVSIKGMSGAPLFEVDFKSENNYKPKLLGILIERDLKAKVIKYVRSKLVIATIINLDGY